jgi:hypothetical protein
MTTFLRAETSFVIAASSFCYYDMKGYNMLTLHNGPQEEKHIMGVIILIRLQTLYYKFNFNLLFFIVQKTIVNNYLVFGSILLPYLKLYNKKYHK